MRTCLQLATAAHTGALTLPTHLLITHLLHLTFPLKQPNLHKVCFFPVLRHTLSCALFRPPNLAPSASLRIHETSRKLLSKTSPPAPQLPFEGHILHHPVHQCPAHSPRNAADEGKTRDFPCQSRQQLQESWMTTSNPLSSPSLSSLHT